jgi:hypothetical protein
LIDLRHGRVHQGVAGSAFAPSLKQSLAVRAMVTMDGIVVGLETALGDVREIGQNLSIKISFINLRFGVIRQRNHHIIFFHNPLESLPKHQYSISRF